MAIALSMETCALNVGLFPIFVLFFGDVGVQTWEDPFLIILQKVKKEKSCLWLHVYLVLCVPLQCFSLPDFSSWPGRIKPAAMFFNQSVVIPRRQITAAGRREPNLLTAANQRAEWGFGLTLWRNILSPGSTALWSGLHTVSSQARLYPNLK